MQLIYVLCCFRIPYIRAKRARTIEVRLKFTYAGDLACWDIAHMFWRNLDSISSMSAIEEKEKERRLSCLRSTCLTVTLSSTIYI